jgi:DNA-binding transcriptional MerR regulator
VNRACALGFTTEAISELLALSDSRQKGLCKQVHDLAVKQIASIRTRREELARMEDALRSLADGCGDQAYDAAHCPILSSLSQPS